MLAIAACGKHSHHRAPDPPPPDPSAQPQLAVAAVAPASLCVTRGALAQARVEVPTFRAVAPGHAGDAASITALVRGASDSARALANGQERRQLGLKLRAADGCNLLYVMWRLDPEPKLEVSLKRNPGMHSSQQCGADGYTKLKPDGALVPPPLADGAPHELRAELRGDALAAWIDGKVVWQGHVPADALELAGPAGVRSDNLALEIQAFSVDARAGGNVDVKCGGDEGEP